MCYNQVMNKERFIEIANQFKEASETSGIGTLSEKTLHRVIKNYLEPNQEKHEVKIGRFYVDIINDNEIIEIQTRQFNKLRGKLDFLLETYQITICFPVAYKKNIIWLNKESLEAEDIRKSPKTGSIYDVFHELYKIKQYLDNPNLRIKIILLDLDEYRLLNGWSKDKKRGSYRYDQIPTALIDEVDIINLKDYKLFIPDGLNKEFTSKDYRKITKLTLKKAQVALNVLRHLGIIELIGKDSRLNLYSLK